MRLAMIDAMLAMKPAFEQASQAPPPGAAPHADGHPHEGREPRRG